MKVHESDFELLAGAEALTEYRFHTQTARHFFCKVCGIYPFHRKRVTPDFFGVNVACLEGFDATGIGDVNGDGLVDLLITSSWSNVNGFRSGRMYIVAGTR